MKLRSKLLLLLSSLAVTGTALAMPVDQFKFFDMQRMITDGYRFPTPDRTAPAVKQEMAGKGSATMDDKKPSTDVQQPRPVDAAVQLRR